MDIHVGGQGFAVDRWCICMCGRHCSSMQILQKHNGTIIFVDYRYLFHCNEALEAEIHAMMQGMALALQHGELPVIMHSDSSMALTIVSDGLLVCSPYGQPALEILASQEVGEFIPQS